MSANTGESQQKGTRSEGGPADAVRELFSKLPFDQKVSTLINIELDLLGDAVGAVASAVSKVVDEIVDACAGDSASPAPDAGSQPSAS